MWRFFEILLTWICNPNITDGLCTDIVILFLPAKKVLQVGCMELGGGKAV